MDINVELFYFFNHNFQNPLFDSVLPIITNFGGFEVLAVVLIVIIVYAHLTDRKTLERLTILALFTFLCCDLVTAVLKHLVHEPRPFVSLDNVNLLITEDDPFSFPSGHSTSTLAVVTFFILNMNELSQKYYKIFDVALIIFALIIPFSRMYVGVHYPGDVLAGAVIGIAGALIVNRFKNRIMKS